MDKELITKLVVEVLTEMQEKNNKTDNYSVKIWHHETPLPKPVVINGPIERNTKVNNEIITFPPYR